MELGGLVQCSCLVAPLKCVVVELLGYFPESLGFLSLFSEHASSISSTGQQPQRACPTALQKGNANPPALWPGRKRPRLKRASGPQMARVHQSSPRGPDAPEQTCASRNPAATKYLWSSHCSPPPRSGPRTRTLQMLAPQVRTCDCRLLITASRSCTDCLAAIAGSSRRARTCGGNFGMTLLSRCCDAPGDSELPGSRAWARPSPPRGKSPARGGRWTTSCALCRFESLPSYSAPILWSRPGPS